MPITRYLIVCLTACALAACGGGGGNPGTTSGTAGSPTVPASGISTTSTTPVLTLVLLDATGAQTSSISGVGFTTLKVTLTNADATPIGQKVISVTGDLTQLKFPDGNTILTDSTTGTATLKVSRANIGSIGAGNLTASYAYLNTTSSGSNAATITSTVGYQLAPLNLALSALNLATNTLPAFGNLPVSVTATVNGVAASSTPVQITFTASCGTVSPTTVNTDSNGNAATTYTASLPTCSGTTVTIGASAIGASGITGAVSIAPSVATNVQFLSTAPNLIYLKDSVGPIQAQVAFKTVDSSGNALQNQKIRLSLSNTATGVNLNTVGNTGPVDLTTDANGLVSVAVYSGTVPTSLNVKAVLLNAVGAATNIFATSNLLTVASGRPTQSSLSLAFSSLSIEGLSIDGQTSTVTLSMADRQGNPVPPGTQVNFVTEGGVMLPAVCFVPPVTPATASTPAIPVSSCNVTIRSQGTRTGNGKVSVLAYVSGEEDFVDANGNNVYDPGEAFTDLGRATRDDNNAVVVPGVAINGNAITNRNQSFDSGEFQVPRDGVAACVPGVGCAGDGVWGAADVRSQGAIIFASSTARAHYTAELPAPTSSSAQLWIYDLNNNSMPTGSTLAVVGSLDGCKPSVTPGIIPNTLLPTRVLVSYASPTKPCSGDVLKLTITTPLGSATTFPIPVP